MAVAFAGRFGDKSQRFWPLRNHFWVWVKKNLQSRIATFGTASQISRNGANSSWFAVRIASTVQKKDVDDSIAGKT